MQTEISPKDSPNSTGWPWRNLPQNLWQPKVNLPTERKVDSSKLERSWCNLPRNLLQNLLATHPRNLGGAFRGTFWPPKMNLPQRTFPRLRKQCCLKTLANWQERPQSYCCFFYQKKRSNIRGPKSCGPSLDDGDYCRIRCGCDVQHLHLEIHVESQAHHLSRESQVKGVDPKKRQLWKKGHHATSHLKRRGKTCVMKNLQKETTPVWNQRWQGPTSGQVTNHVDDLAICSPETAWKHKWPLQGLSILEPLPPRCNLALPWRWSWPDLAGKTHVILLRATRDPVNSPVEVGS